MIKEKNQRSWNDIQKIDRLEPSIKDANDYNRKILSNMAIIDIQLEEKRNLPFLKSDDIKALHKQMFEGVTTFGGQNADRARDFGSRFGAEPPHIDTEMKLLDKQMDELWSKAKTDSDRVNALAFQHIRLVNIHGFYDGNGRTARAVSKHGLNSLDKTSSQLYNVNRDVYIQANGKAMDHGNIGVLAANMASAWGVNYEGNVYNQTPFRIAPFREDMTVEEAYKQSKIKEPDALITSGKYLKERHFDEIVQNVGGKWGKDFEKTKTDFYQEIKTSKSLNQTVDKIKKIKDSGALKSGLFKKTNEEGYAKVAMNTLKGVSDSLEDDKKAEFAYIVTQKLNGQKYDLDDFVLKNTKIQIPSKTRINQKGIEDFEKNFQKNREMNFKRDIDKDIGRSL